MFCCRPKRRAPSPDPCHEEPAVVMASPKSVKEDSARVQKQPEVIGANDVELSVVSDDELDPSIGGGDEVWATHEAAMLRVPVCPSEDSALTGTSVSSTRTSVSPNAHRLLSEGAARDAHCGHLDGFAEEEDASEAAHVKVKISSLHEYRAPYISSKSIREVHKEYAHKQRSATSRVRNPHHLNGGQQSSTTATARSLGKRSSSFSNIRSEREIKEKQRIVMELQDALLTASAKKGALTQHDREDARRRALERIREKKGILEVVPPSLATIATSHTASALSLVSPSSSGSLLHSQSHSQVQPNSTSSTGQQHRARSGSYVASAESRSKPLDGSAANDMETDDGALVFVVDLWTGHVVPRSEHKVENVPPAHLPIPHPPAPSYAATATRPSHLRTQSSKNSITSVSSSNSTATSTSAALVVTSPSASGRSKLITTKRSANTSYSALSPWASESTTSVMSPPPPVDIALSSSSSSSLSSLSSSSAAAAAAVGASAQSISASGSAEAGTAKSPDSNNTTMTLDELQDDSLTNLEALIAKEQEELQILLDASRRHYERRDTATDEFSLSEQEFSDQEDDRNSIVDESDGHHSRDDVSSTSGSYLDARSSVAPSPVTATAANRRSSADSEICSAADMHPANESCASDMSTNSSVQCLDRTVLHFPPFSPLQVAGNMILHAESQNRVLPDSNEDEEEQDSSKPIEERDEFRVLGKIPPEWDEGESNSESQESMQSPIVPHRSLQSLDESLDNM
eukprot:ANDGO_02484.mRNA.1 hypothetical protein